MIADFSALLARGDLDELVDVADRLALAGEWDELLQLRAGCASAAEMFGRQLWGVAQFAEYRLALDAPAALAASVVVPGAARFALGPLTEVVAQHHVFAELADDLHPAVINVVAQERVLRGEDLTTDLRHDIDESTLPGLLQPWEPAYRLPVYRRTDRLDGDPLVEIHDAHDVIDGMTSPVSTRAQPQLERALGGLVEAWVRESSGVAKTVSVTGGPAAALGVLGIARARVRPVPLTRAVDLMASASSSGGVAGRRRGGAAGRMGAWWVLAAACMTDLPADPDELEYHAEERRWYEFDTEPTTASTGSTKLADDDGGRGGDASTAPGQGAWSLRLMVEDPRAGWTAAIAAYDAADTPKSPF